jgi:GNAT superfamily N-acetyltransferase
MDEVPGFGPLMFRPVRLDGPIALGLTGALEEEVIARYDGEPGSEPPLQPDGFQPPLGRFFVAWAGHEPVGCGGICPLEEGVAQLRRMYVVPGARRLGVARRLLALLEDTARALGYRSIRLETGTAQPEAVEMYRAAGYDAIPAYGEYAGDPRSLCFEKRLAG